MNAPRPRGPLLRNMSAPPRTRINHQPADRRDYGRGLVFTLPEGDDLAAAEVLARLDGRPCQLSPPAAEAELRRRLNVHARALPLPRAALIAFRRTSDDTECRDLLSVLTVLAKSSAHVYLRDKEPTLTSLQAGRRVILLLPTGPNCYQHEA